MAGGRGVIFPLSSPDSEKVQEQIEARGFFTDHIRLDVKFGGRAVCLLVLDSIVDKIGLIYTPMQRNSSTLTKLVRIDSFVELDPLVLTDVIEELPARFRTILGTGRISDVDSIPPGAFTALLARIGELQPNSRAQIDELSRRARSAGIYLPGAVPEVEELERDAEFLALEFSGFDRRTATPLREDTMVNHDWINIPGWNLRGSAQVGKTIFQREGGTLTVYNVNRMPLETTVGVDLIYQHGQYNSFIFVQYKRFERSDNDNRLVYYPASDSSYTRELERMKEVEKLASLRNASDYYRLSTGASYIKLCVPFTYKPDSSKMIAGMYIPLAYWEQLCNSENAQGKKGGVAINYDAIDRRITNTMFIELVKGGWVGTGTVATGVLDQVVNDVLDSGSAAILASYETT